jgi:hypothetical protein
MLNFVVTLTPSPQAMLQIIKAFAGNAAIIQPTCATLSKLSVTSQNQVTIAAAGGIQVRITTFLHYHCNLCTLIIQNSHPKIHPWML